MKTILVVDDDANIRLLLRDDLWEKGYNVVTAVDGDEAVVSFAEEHVDLVILDIRMPKLNGIEVLKIIRGAKSEVPIIIYTANPDDLDDTSSYGNTYKITKSSDMMELMNTVEKILND